MRNILQEFLIKRLKTYICSLTQNFNSYKFQTCAICKIRSVLWLLNLTSSCTQKRRWVWVRSPFTNELYTALPVTGSGSVLSVIQSGDKNWTLKYLQIYFLLINYFSFALLRIFIFPIKTRTPLISSKYNINLILHKYKGGK